MKKLFRSLQAKYMLLIIIAIALVQVAYILSALIMTGLDNQLNGQSSNEQTFIEVEQHWHDAAKKMTNANPATVEHLFEQWANEYPQASMYWINEDGELISSRNLTTNVPQQWTSTYTVSFIKERYGGDPFTVVAFVGESKANGFVVFEISRAAFNSLFQNVYDEYGYLLIITSVTIIILFIFISYLFFRSIQKRLLKLQLAMNSRSTEGLPIQIKVSKQDEISQLEHTFNQMIIELSDSKKREHEEELLRRELIANLSHDLRTPLTKIRAQAYSLSKSVIEEEDKRSVLSLENSVKQMDGLIDNLMAYTLLMTQKYRLELQDVDIIRFLKEHTATWYSAFEHAQFEIEISFEKMQHPIWKADPIWLGRIFDNVFQNVLRHASSGQYISIKGETRGNIDVIIISDRGPGMQSETEATGARIGLSIVDMMVKGQHLNWKTLSSDEGLTIEIYRERTKLKYKKV